MSLFFCCCLAASTLAVTTGRRPRHGEVSPQAGGGGVGTALFLLTGSKRLQPPAGLKGAPKAAEVEDGEDPPGVAELPPKPLPQTMLPRNVTADALKPPLGAAQVAPPPRQLVDVDVCRYVLFFCDVISSLIPDQCCYFLSVLSHSFVPTSQGFCVFVPVI